MHSWGYDKTEVDIRIIGLGFSGKYNLGMASVFYV